MNFLNSISFLFLFMTTLLAHSNTNNAEPGFFNIMSTSPTINKTEVFQSDPFNYEPELEGQNFSLVSINGFVEMTLACDGLDFDAAASKFKSQIEQTLDYAMDNWQIIGANYLIFTQPAIASMVQNINDALQFDIGSTLVSCQGSRDAAKRANADDWGAHLAHQACMNRTGGDQLKCLQEAGTTASIDSYNSAILSKRAALNDWITSNSSKSGTHSANNEINITRSTCTISEMSENVCSEGSKILSDLSYKTGSTSLQTTQAEMTIPQYISYTKNIINNELIQILTAKSKQESSSAKSSLYSVSYGTASISNEKVEMLLNLYSSNRGKVVDDAIDNLSTLWAFATTRKLLENLRYGYQDAIAKGNPLVPDDTGDKIISMINSKIDLLDSYKREYETKQSEDSIWKSVDKLNG
jgi:hypothetical protein